MERHGDVATRNHLFDMSNTCAESEYMPAGKFDVEALTDALDARRRAEGISWREVARRASVSPSTLTRMQQGKLPDVNTFAALVRWLDMKAEEFLPAAPRKGRQQPAPSPQTVAVTALLRGKKELSPEAKEALDELLQAAIKLAGELK